MLALHLVEMFASDLRRRRHVRVDVAHGGLRRIGIGSGSHIIKQREGWSYGGEGNLSGGNAGVALIDELCSHADSAGCGGGTKQNRSGAEADADGVAAILLEDIP